MKIKTALRLYLAVMVIAMIVFFAPFVPQTVSYLSPCFSACAVLHRTAYVSPSYYLVGLGGVYIGVGQQYLFLWSRQSLF